MLDRLQYSRAVIPQEAQQHPTVATWLEEGSSWLHFMAATLHNDVDSKIIFRVNKDSIPNWLKLGRELEPPAGLGAPSLNDWLASGRPGLEKPEVSPGDLDWLAENGFEHLILNPDWIAARRVSEGSDGH